MAKSSGAKGFEYRKSLLAVGVEPVTLKIRIGNSQTLTLGDAVRVNDAGHAVVVAAGEAVLGIVTGFKDSSGDAKGGGVNPLASFYVNDTGATLTPDDTIVTASDNTSRANYLLAEVAVDPAGIMCWYNDANGDFAQTNLFQFFDTTASGDQIDQASALDTNGQFQLVEIDPDNDADASKGLFIIAESQVRKGIIDSATDVLAA